MLGFGLVIALAGGSDAALEKYDVTFQGSVNSNNVVPNPNSGKPVINAEQSVALVDSAAGPNPVLRKFVRAVDFTITTVVPGLAIALFSSSNYREGPGVLAQIHGGSVPPFTGTGSTATNVRWGVVSGWTITGSTWCNSNPGVICVLGMMADQATTEPRFNSTFYDLGTWSFHGTGFTSVPFIGSTFSSDVGNQVYLVRGFATRDGTVPALPLLGVVVLGASLIAGGVVAARRSAN
jgi:hypothetical protein